MSILCNSKFPSCKVYRHALALSIEKRILKQILVVNAGKVLLNMVCADSCLCAAIELPAMSIFEI